MYCKTASSHTLNALNNLIFYFNCFVTFLVHYEYEKSKYVSTVGITPDIGSDIEFITDWLSLHPNREYINGTWYRFFHTLPDHLNNVKK